MNKSFSKILMLVVLVLAVLGAALYAMTGIDMPSAAGPELDAAEIKLGIVVGRYVTYALLLLIVAVALALIFSLLNLVKKPALLKKALLSLAVLGVVLAAAYFMADGDAVYDASGNIFAGSEGSVSKWVGTFINYSMILIIVGAVLFVYDMIKNLIK